MLKIYIFLHYNYKILYKLSRFLINILINSSVLQKINFVFEKIVNVEIS